MTAIRANKVSLFSNFSFLLDGEVGLFETAEFKIFTLQVTEITRIVMTQKLILFLSVVSLAFSFQCASMAFSAQASSWVD